MQHSFQFLKRKYQSELFSLFIFLAGKNKDNTTLKATVKMVKIVCLGLLRNGKEQSYLSTYSIHSGLTHERETNICIFHFISL